MTEDILLQFGYVGLFLVSFAAATVLPLSSEPLLAIMVSTGYDPWLVWLSATIGNYLGALTTYYVGQLGARFLLSRYIKVRPETLSKAQRLYGRWGAPILLLSWLPLIGDPLTFVAGTLNVRLSFFTVFVLIGVGLRYAAILGAVSYWPWAN